MEIKNNSRLDNVKLKEGLERAYEKMIDDKKRKKTPLIVSQNGQIVEIDPHKAEPPTTYHWG